jgi:hypothetical protein
MRLEVPRRVSKPGGAEDWFPSAFGMSGILPVEDV